MQIEVSPQALAIIGNALVERPYKEVSRVIADIERQVQEHNAKLAQAEHDAAADRRDMPGGAAVPSEIL